MFKILAALFIFLPVAGLAQPGPVAPVQSLPLKPGLNFRADPQALDLAIDIRAARLNYAELGVALAKQLRVDLDSVERASIELGKRPRARNLKVLRELLGRARTSWAELRPLCQLNEPVAGPSCAELNAPIEQLISALAPPLTARQLREEQAAVLTVVKVQLALAIKQAEVIVASTLPDQPIAQAINAQDNFEYLGRLLGAMVIELHLEQGSPPSAAQVSALRTLYFAQTANVRRFGLSAALQSQAPALDQKMQRAIGTLAPKIARGASLAEINVARRNLAREIRDLGIALKVLVIVPGL